MNNPKKNVLWNFPELMQTTCEKILHFLAANCWTILAISFYGILTYEIAFYFCPSALTRKITSMVDYIANKVGDDIQKEAILLEKLKAAKVAESDPPLPKYLLLPTHMLEWHDLVHFFETNDLKPLPASALSRYITDLNVILYCPKGVELPEWQAYLFTIDNALTHVGQHFRIVKGLMLGSDYSHFVFKYIKAHKYLNNETILDTLKRLHEHRNYILEAVTDEERLQRYLEIKQADYRIRHSQHLGNSLGFYLMLIVFACAGYAGYNLFTSEFFEFITDV